MRKVLLDLIEADRVALCGPVRCEVIRGAPRTQVNRIQRVFTGVHYLTQQDEDWKRVETAALKLHGEGHQPPLLDVLIAAVAYRCNAILCHFGDRHFQTIQKVIPFSAVNLHSARGKGQ